MDNENHAIRVTQVVAAYLAHHHVPENNIASLVGTIDRALATIGQPVATKPAEPEVEKPSPAQIKRSVTADGLISFIDGKSYKTIKRHLTTHGLTPDRYRERYGLPADYPMTCPSYSAQRSALAKEIGLGKSGAQAERQNEA